ncbi:MAG: glutathione S-transferase family protein [Hyphomonadaceae bacterium]
MAEIEFWTNPMSRGRIVHWMLEELGEPYDIHWLEWGEHKSPDYLAINPMGKIPAIRHTTAANGPKVVTEAAAICLYLADVYPAAGLKPGPEGLADYYRWTLFAAGPAEHAVTSKSMGWDVPAERKGTVGFGDYDDVVSTLEGMLKGRTFVCGETFTAADVYFGSSILWGVDFGTLPALPALQLYADRLRERPAHRKVLDVCTVKAAASNH